MASESDHTNDRRILRLKRIHDFVDVQYKLISMTRAQLAPSITEYDLKDALPSTIVVDGTTWCLGVHGIGVRFVNAQTSVVVDVHVGMFDAPDGFDAWRLTQYDESLSKAAENVSSWSQTLAELVRDGFIELHPSRSRHFRLKEHP